jgi:hypothetical protein
MKRATDRHPVLTRLSSSGDTGPRRWRRLALALALCGCVLLLDSDAEAQYVTLSLSPSTISFSSADPDDTPVLTSPTITASYVVLFSFGQSWTISLQADDDLRNGTSTIRASSVSWTASPSPPFRAGTLSTATAQTLASGSGDAWTSGTVTFTLPNSWNYDVGTYSATITFTLACP